MKWKKLCSLLLAVSLSAGLLTGCQASSSSDSTAVSESIESESIADSESAEGASDISEAEEESPDSYPWLYTLIEEINYDEKPDPQDDFYSYVNYDWKMSLPAGTSYAGTLTDSTERTEAILSLINDESITDSAMAELRKMYEQALDRDTLNEQGIAPLLPYTEKILHASSIEELNQVITAEDFYFDVFASALPSSTYLTGSNIYTIWPVFAFVEQLDGAAEYQDLDETIEYSFLEESMSLSEAIYVSGAIFNALGCEERYDDLPDAMSFEIKYGKVSPYQSYVNDVPWGTVGDSYSRFTLDELSEKFGAFPIKEILTNRGQTGFDTYSVLREEWIDELASIYTEENLEIIKSNMLLMICKEAMSYLGDDPFDFTGYIEKIVSDMAEEMASGNYEDADLSSSQILEEDDMNTDVELTDEELAELEAMMEVTEDDESSEELYTPEEISPEETAVDTVTALNTFGLYLADLYVNDYLGQGYLDRLTAMTDNIIDTYADMFENCEWMDDESKAAALKKLENMQLNILIPQGGYPDYSSIRLNGDTLLDNYFITKQYKNDCINAMIGADTLPIAAWYLFSPLISNAFYDCETNSINIIPGILNDNIFTPDMSDEEMYGAVGSVVGHEISHAFDYSGSQYDEIGAPNSWLSEESMTKFLENTQTLIDYYNTIILFDGETVDGETVKTEAAADLSAVQVLLAYAREQEDWDYKAFFESFGRVFAAQYSYVNAIMINQADVHPAGNLRINVNVQMFDEFYETYNVSEEDGMYLAPEARINLW